MIVDGQINMLMLALSAGMASIDEEDVAGYANRLLSVIDKAWLNEYQGVVVQFMHKTKMISFVDRIFPFIESCQLFELVELYRALVAVTMVRRSMLEPVFTALKYQNVDVMPYKGMDFIYNYHSLSAHRFISDVDLIIRPSQLTSAVSVFERMGFFQAEVSKDKLSADGQSLYMQPWALDASVSEARSIRPYVKIARVESLQPHQEILSAYTVIYLSGSPMVIAYIDLEFSVLPEIEEEDVWRRTRSAKVAGNIYPGLCPELYICSLFYRACTVSNVLDAAAVYPFVDAVRVVVAGGIDWDYLWRIAERYNLVVPVSSCLIEVAAITKSSIPAEVFIRCQKNLKPHYASNKPSLLEWLGVISAVL
ncbi:nucleotidyltransferase family protein [Pseudomonas chlororaphis]|uniref:nucleotidyltransferase family protein n=1 Tax=Pseudomonas chlororaphis TaxID=587753 RepID=UPI0030D33588